MEEIWKTMKEHNNYEVSNYGKIKNKKTSRVLKTTKNNKGYERFIIYINKKPKCFYIHRVVANNFLENINNFPEVNHKNENKNDNRVDNLEYCDGLYNLSYGTRVERILKSKEHTFKRILQKDKNNNIIKEWANILEIKEKTKYNRHSIYKCCEGIHKTAYGYKWEYIEK